MNLTLYKRRRLRQKPHILTIEQSQELGQLAGNKQLKHVTDQGLIPTNLFRLRKRKLELIYKYLLDRHLVHDKEPAIESLQTHQLAEYLLNIIYPGYPACKAKNQAYTDYRQCREKDVGQIPLAYDYVPTTEVYERLDELYRIDVNWQEDNNMQPFIDIPISTLKKSIDRIRAGNFEKPIENIEYHLLFWNSTRTLLKPQCKSLKLNTEEIWSDKKEKMVAEGFMHVDITERLKHYINISLKRVPTIKSTDKNDKAVSKPINDKSTAVPISKPTNDKSSAVPISKPTNDKAKSTKSNNDNDKASKSVKAISIATPTNNNKAILISAPTNKPISSQQQETVNNNNQKKSTSPPLPPSPPPPPPPALPVKEKCIKFEIELEKNDEYNISHISISAVTKKSTNELVSDLYLQTTTECIARSLQTSLFPLDTQQIIVHLLKQYHESEEKLKSAENIFMTCLSNTFNKSFSSSSEEEDDDEDMNEIVSLIDPVSNTRIQHPMKSLHCRHRSCFDAAIFFDHNADIKLWHCPICFVHIKNIEELRMDYTNKVALAQYPDEEKLFVLQKDTLLSETEMFGEDNRIIIADDGDEQNKRPYLICDREEQEEVDHTDDEHEVHHHAQKRFRTLTHVM